MNFVVILCFVISTFHYGWTQKLGDLNCRSRTNMDAFKRKTFLEEHNWKRYFLAGGQPFPDKRHVKYPTASDMSVLYYDCELENEAYDIARECTIGRLDFNYVGTNNATLKGDHYPFNIIPKIVNLWWKTALQGGNLVHLMPSERNEPMIPFLQMANGKTNRLGCAYHVCSEDSDDDDEEEEESFVLFVCKYGEENIRIGQPIYTSGPPCGSCRNKCTFNKRLCDI